MNSDHTFAGSRRAVSNWHRSISLAVFLVLVAAAPAMRLTRCSLAITLPDQRVVMRTDEFRDHGETSPDEYWLRAGRLSFTENELPLVIHPDKETAYVDGPCRVDGSGGSVETKLIPFVRVRPAGSDSTAQWQIAEEWMRARLADLRGIDRVIVYRRGVEMAKYNWSGGADSGRKFDWARVADLLTFSVEAPQTENRVEVPEGALGKQRVNWQTAERERAEAAERARRTAAGEKVPEKLEGIRVEVREGLKMIMGAPPEHQPLRGDFQATETSRMSGEWVLVGFMDGVFAGSFRSGTFVVERRVGCDWKKSGTGPVNPDLPDAYTVVETRPWYLSAEQRTAFLSAFGGKTNGSASGR